MPLAGPVRTTPNLRTGSFFMTTLTVAYTLAQLAVLVRHLWIAPVLPRDDEIWAACLFPGQEFQRCASLNEVKSSKWKVI